MNNEILKKLLGQSRATVQIMSAGLGSFIGLTLLLFSVQTRFDLGQIMGGSTDSDNYITINKPVTLANTLLGKSVFSSVELTNLGRQPFIESVCAFTSNRFKVSASSRILNFYTDLFFESVPPQYLDVSTANFKWQSGSDDLPIILSKDYLALYNFGFAVSQGLPQFTPATIKQVSLDITLRGNGREQVFRGHIVGFSERLNSVLVPLDFMTYANNMFGDQPDIGTSRVMLKVANPYDKSLTNFLSSEGYELSAGRLVGGKIGTVVTALIVVLSAISILFMILSVIVFMLNYQLVISKSLSDIRLLRELGYKSATIFELLRGSLLRLLLGVFTCVIVVLGFVRFRVLAWLESQGFDIDKNYSVWVYALGIGLMCLIVFITLSSLKKHIEAA